MNGRPVVIFIGRFFPTHAIDLNKVSGVLHIYFYVCVVKCWNIIFHIIHANLLFV